jgi:hypothetical protein
VRSEMETPYCVERRIKSPGGIGEEVTQVVGLEFAPQVLKLPCVRMSNPLSLP